MNARIRRLATLLPALVVAAGLTVTTAPANADSNPYQRGPDPTLASVTTANGPFATAQVAVPTGTSTGFKDGTIYYPTDTSHTYGAIAIMPGFVSPEGTVDWYGPVLASQGFVVMALDSEGYFDFPAARGTQTLAAVNWLATRSPVVNEIDPSRLAVMGWSMGGGGVLEDAADTPTLKAAIAFAPWDLNNPTSKIKVPTFIMGDDTDILAPNGTFALPFYKGLTNARDRGYLELKNANHFTFTSFNTTITEYSIAWLKRFVDNDTRYDQFLCPTPSASAAVVQFMDSCPLS